jgi:phosphocarrier protein
MNGVTLQRQVLIVNAEGLHLRPMSKFVETAGRFQSQVTVVKDKLAVDGKSMMGLMGLAAEQGTLLLLQACGPDAPAALDALVELLASMQVGKDIQTAPPVKD